MLVTAEGVFLNILRHRVGDIFLTFYTVHELYIDKFMDLIS